MWWDSGAGDVDVTLPGGAYRLDLDPRELDSRPDDVPPELRERLFAELESVAHDELSPEEQLAVEARLADLGYL